jgi:hypothetical protein
MNILNVTLRNLVGIGAVRSAADCGLEEHGKGQGGAVEHDGGLPDR